MPFKVNVPPPCLTKLIPALPLVPRTPLKVVFAVLLTVNVATVPLLLKTALEPKLAVKPDSV